MIPIQLGGGGGGVGGCMLTGSKIASRPRNFSGKTALARLPKWIHKRSTLPGMVWGIVGLMPRSPKGASHSLITIIGSC